MLTVVHWWKLKGRDKDLAAAIQRANEQSWYSTYARDGDGDLMVSSYLFMTESIGEDDLAAFLEKEPDQFMAVANASGLVKFVQ